MDRENFFQVLDITVTIVLFVIACVIGKLIMKNIVDTWLAFNGPALTIVIIGELIWWKIRKRIWGDDNVC